MAQNGPIERFLAKLEGSLANDTFVRLRLSNPHLATQPERIQMRVVELKTGRHLSFTLSFPTRDETKNLSVAEGVAWVAEMVNQQYQNAFLSTIRGDWQLIFTEKDAVRLVAHQATVTESPPRTHDEPRRLILDVTAQDWLKGLGVTNAIGQVVTPMSDKHRQINRYLEILSHLVKDCGWLDRSARPNQPDLVFADMGCGKGYLTFGAWHLFRRHWKLPVRVVGVEQRPELVSTCSNLVRQLSAQGLDFISGDIATTVLPRVDALVALHACDTATDDAIRRGIELGAKLIVVAPCCHKEIRHQLGKPTPLAPVLQHGIMAERMAEWVTDGLRALYLEYAGYETKIFEFVSSEHTPKNLMISAVRRPQPGAPAKVQEQILKLKSFFDIRSHPLDVLRP
jgi:SAM-dependent methyltransferase